MRLLLDEMYTGLKDHLEVLGWEVETVRDAGFSGKMDKEIVEYAKKRDRILVTQDQKLAELAEILEVKHVFISNAMVAKMIDLGIRERYHESSSS